MLLGPLADIKGISLHDGGRTGTCSHITSCRGSKLTLTYNHCCLKKHPLILHSIHFWQPSIAYIQRLFPQFFSVLKWQGIITIPQASCRHTVCNITTVVDFAFLGTEGIYMMQCWGHFGICMRLSLIHNKQHSRQQANPDCHLPCLTGTHTHWSLWVPMLTIYRHSHN